VTRRRGRNPKRPTLRVGRLRSVRSPLRNVLQGVEELVERFLLDPEDPELLRRIRGTRDRARLSVIVVDAAFLHRREGQNVSTLCALLEGFGRSSFSALCDGIGDIEVLHGPEDVYLLESLALVIGRLRDRRGVESLRAGLRRLRQTLRSSPPRLLRVCCEAAQVTLIRILCDLGDEASGRADLLHLLGEGRHRVPPDVIELLARSAPPPALVPLARLHRLEAQVSLEGAHEIREAIRRIARRYGFESEAFAAEGAEEPERELLKRILARRRGPPEPAPPSRIPTDARRELSAAEGDA
jgi:hypothetical protein